MAIELGAEYLELANSQYYSWALLNRDQLLPMRAQLERAERVTNEYREKYGDKIRIFFVVPDYHEKRPKKCMNGWGNVLPDGHARRHRAAVPHREDAPRARVPERARDGRARDLVHNVRLQRYPRDPRMKESCRTVPRQGKGPRRLPLPGLLCSRRPGRGGPGVREVARARGRARSARAGRVEGGRADGENGAADIPRPGHLAPPRRGRGVKGKRNPVFNSAAAGPLSRRSSPATRASRTMRHCHAPHRLAGLISPGVPPGRRAVAPKARSAPDGRRTADDIPAHRNSATVRGAADCVGRASAADVATRTRSARP